MDKKSLKVKIFLNFYRTYIKVQDNEEECITYVASSVIATQAKMLVRQILYLRIFFLFCKKKKNKTKFYDSCY